MLSVDDYISGYLVRDMFRKRDMSRANILRAYVNVVDPSPSVTCYETLVNAWYYINALKYGARGTLPIRSIGLEDKLL